MKKLKANKGITLIALIITIIILLILAVVTIMSVNGDGIISKAKQAKAEYQNAQIEEQNILDKYLAEMEGLVGNNTSIGDNTLPGEENPDNIELISKTEPYVGYYADVNSDGTVDGVIYADLAVGNTKDGQWTNSNGNYTINKIEDVKDYYISQTNYEGSFGTKDVLCATGEGNERFYVMALEDFNPGTYYCWYNAANGNMSDYATATSEDFGTGRTNTATMIEKWNNKAYGAQNNNGTYKDMWGEIQTKVNEGWFVPTRGEWSAFAEELGITKENYTSKNLSGPYWSSSPDYTSDVWYATFFFGCMSYYSVTNGSYVRLGTTF